MLAQYAERRDELEEQCERDDLVSMESYTTFVKKFADVRRLYSIFSKGRPYSLLSASEETKLIEILEARPRTSMSVAEAIILRKLKVHRVCIAKAILQN